MSRQTCQPTDNRGPTSCPSCFPDVRRTHDKQSKRKAISKDCTIDHSVDNSSSPSPYTISVHHLQQRKQKHTRCTKRTHSQERGSGPRKHASSAPFQRRATSRRQKPLTGDAGRFVRIGVGAVFFEETGAHTKSRTIAVPAPVLVSRSRNREYPNDPTQASGDPKNTAARARRCSLPKNGAGRHWNDVFLRGRRSYITA